MWIMLDIEATGPVPGLYSMFWFGAVVVKPELEDIFEGKLRPLHDAGFEGGPSENIGLRLAGVKPNEVAEWPQPLDTMYQFLRWLDSMKNKHNDDRLMLISDNNGYDAMWITWYFHRFIGTNPFGHSSTNLGSLYKGLVNDTFKNFKHLRRTQHTHNPVDDARGNAEALLHMHEHMGLKIRL